MDNLLVFLLDQIEVYNIDFILIDKNYYLDTLILFLMYYVFSSIVLFINKHFKFGIGK